MPITSAQILSDAANCYDCIDGVSRMQAVRISILAGSLATLNSDAIMTAQQLIDAAECYTCLPGVNDADAVEIYLLDQVSQNITGGGGGGGTGQIKYYVADPNSEGVVPDDQTKPAIATKQDGSGSIVTWNVGSLLWN